jgi:hypothetical protein
LRIKLWIGWLFGWDKQGVRAMLLVVACLTAFVLFVLVYDGVISPVIFPEPEGLTPAQREELREMFKDRLQRTPVVPAGR